MDRDRISLSCSVSKAGARNFESCTRICSNGVSLTGGMEGVPMKKAWLVTGAALLLSSCGSTKIGRILADPARYQNRGVTVEGTVTNVVGAFVAGVYQVDD